MAPVIKNTSANAGDISNAVLIPGLGRSPGRGNGNPRVQSPDHKDPLEEEMAAHSSTLAWSRGQRSPVGWSQWGLGKSQTGLKRLSMRA